MADLINKQNIFYLTGSFYMAAASPDIENESNPRKKKQGEKQLHVEIAPQPIAKYADQWWLHKKYINWLGYCLTLIPVVVYFNIVNAYAVNIPYKDDYNAILEFLTRFKTANFIERVTLLFSQHSDHRIFHSRVIYVLYYYIFGKINFVHLIFLANLQLVVIYFILIHFIKKSVPVYWSIVGFFVGFCLFDASSYENADFAMSGIQNYGVIMLFLVSLYFYNKSGRNYLIAAGLFESICVFSSGNGMICALCLVVFTVLSRQKIKSITSLAILIICAPLYYFHFYKATALGGFSDLFTSARDVIFFFHMLGNHFSFENGIIIGVCELILLIVLLPVEWKSKLNLKPGILPFISILGALIGTSLSISVFRSNDERLGELASYGSRYLIYPHMFAAVLYLFLWMKIEGKNKVWHIITIAGAVFILIAYANNTTYGKMMLIKVQKRLEFHPYFYKQCSQQDIEDAKKIADVACMHGIYCIDQNFLNDVWLNAIKINPAKSMAGFSVNIPSSPYIYIFTLMDVNGKKLATKQYNTYGKDITVDMNIASGNYILKIQNDNKCWQNSINIK